MSLNSEKIEGKLILFFKKVINNAATNYYKKKNRYQIYEFSSDNFDNDSLIELANDSSKLVVIVMGMPLFIEDEVLAMRIEKLNLREKYILREKFILGKTDREIGEDLGISRQGVTNLKHRMYKKIRDAIKQLGATYFG